MKTDYSGPSRHLHITLAEHDGGMTLSMASFQIIRGQRKFRRVYPIRTVLTHERPRSEAELLELAGRLFRADLGA